MSRPCVGLTWSQSVSGRPTPGLFEDDLHWELHRRGGGVVAVGSETDVDGAGALHVDGEDLGPGTAMVSSDGEYEWFMTVARADVDRLVALLGGQAGDDVLVLLERDWTGSRSYDLERPLRESGIPVNLFTWGG